MLSAPWIILFGLAVIACYVALFLVWERFLQVQKLFLALKNARDLGSDLALVKDELYAVRESLKKLHSRAGMREMRERRNGETDLEHKNVQAYADTDGQPPPQVTNEQIADRMKNGPTVPLDKPCPNHVRDPVGWLIWQQADINRRRQAARK